jgi:hypothetical protein
MSLFRVRNPGILFDADSPAKSTAVVTGQGAPSGGSLLDGADAAIYIREDASGPDFVIYATATGGTKWAPVPFVTQGGDPGDGEAIAVTNSANIAITTGGSGETNTLAIPTFVGQQLMLSLDVDGGGDRVVTVTGNVNAAGNNTITFATAGESIVLDAFTVAGALVWRKTGGDAGLTTV